MFTASYRQKQLAQQKELEFAMSNEAMLAEFMDRVSQIADVVDQSQPDNRDCAGQLRLAVDDLRDVRLQDIRNLYDDLQ